MSQPAYKKRDIVAAYCRSAGLTGPAAEAVEMSLQSMMNRQVLKGYRHEDAGRTAALLYPAEEACFAAVVLHMKDFGFSHDIAKGLRPGFLDWRLPGFLDLIREDHSVIMSLQFGHVARGRLDRVQPYVWCALHEASGTPDWTPYVPDTRPPPAVRSISFSAPWPITDLLRSFLFSLEADE